MICRIHAIHLEDRGVQAEIGVKHTAIFQPSHEELDVAGGVRGWCRGISPTLFFVGEAATVERPEESSEHID